MRRRRAGQLLAEKEAHDLGDAGLICLAGGLDLAVLITLVQRRLEIVADALEVTRADGLDPRAFGGFEDGTGAVEIRAELAMG